MSEAIFLASVSLTKQLRLLDKETGDMFQQSVTNKNNVWINKSYGPIELEIILIIKHNAYAPRTLISNFTSLSFCSPTVKNNCKFLLSPHKRQTKRAQVADSTRMVMYHPGMVLLGTISVNRIKAMLDQRRASALHHLYRSHTVIMRGMHINHLIIIKRFYNFWSWTMDEAKGKLSFSL